MKAYLLRDFSKKAKLLAVDQFLVRFPGDWLVWEAGRWHPSMNRPGTVVYEPPNAAEPPGGEALAIVLEPGKARPEALLGRAPENDVAIDDATVSRTHLVSKKTQHTWRVVDQGSSNGSTLDGEKLHASREVPLADGMRLTAGGARLTYHDARGFYDRLRSMG